MKLWVIFKNFFIFIKFFLIKKVLNRYANSLNIIRKIYGKLGDKEKES
jgi:hypothetical protein